MTSYNLKSQPNTSSPFNLLCIQSVLQLFHMCAIFFCHSYWAGSEWRSFDRFFGTQCPTSLFLFHHQHRRLLSIFASLIVYFKYHINGLNWRRCVLSRPLMIFQIGSMRIKSGVSRVHEGPHIFGSECGIFNSILEDRYKTGTRCVPGRVKARTHVAYAFNSRAHEEIASNCSNLPAVARILLLTYIRHA